MNRFISIYYLIINLAAFIFYGADKRKAVRGDWRIPEKTLLLLALAGGGIGAFLGMQIFRHKTQHMGFVIGFPLIALLQWGAVIWMLLPD